MGEPALRLIAHELVQLVRTSVTVDWTQREAARANIRRATPPLTNSEGRWPPGLGPCAQCSVR
jgi:type I restriction enzyme, R subunit